MSYRNLIDRALEAAQARAHTPVETAKIASAPDALVKEAMDVAGALEFVSLSATGGGRAAGFREEMIREFYKTATAGNPASGPTAASGTQGIAPAAGKTKIAPKGLVGGNAPAQSTVSAATKDGDKAMLESFKQAGGQSLYDILMGNKTAAAGGPAEHDSETSAGVGTANENSTYRKTLHSNEGPVNANRRDLKKSTRARLAEAFAHTGDTLGDTTAAQIFPQAASRGSLKVADFLKEGAAAKGPRREERLAAHRKRVAARRAASTSSTPSRPQGLLTGRTQKLLTGPTSKQKLLTGPTSKQKLLTGPSQSASVGGTQKRLRSSIENAPSFVSRHKGKMLAGGGAALLAAGGAGLYARNRESSKTASRKEEPSARLRELRKSSLNEIVDVQPLVRTKRSGDAREARSLSVVDKMRELQRAYHERRAGSPATSSGSGGGGMSPPGGRGPATSSGSGGGGMSPPGGRGVPSADSMGRSSSLPPNSGARRTLSPVGSGGKKLLGAAAIAALLAAGGVAATRKKSRSDRSGSSKTASREDAALAGAVHPFLAAAAADEGRKKRTLAGGIAGQTMGGLAGLGLSALALRKHDPIALLGAGPMLGVGLGGAAGGAIGSYLGHGKNITPQERMMRAKLDADLAAEAAKRGD